MLYLALYFTVLVLPLINKITIMHMYTAEIDKEKAYKMFLVVAALKILH